MVFKNEVGGIVDQNGHLISITEGEPYRVVFPQEIIHQLHKNNPGSIYLLAHTHPPEMTRLSGEDISTLKAQALWMYPYPARMSTITRVTTFQGEDGAYEEIIETIYLGLWQSKEDWKKENFGSDVILPRRFTIVKESSSVVVPSSGLYNSVLANMSYFDEGGEEESCLVS